MKKFLSLEKAMMSRDMNLFKIKAKGDKNSITNVLFSSSLALLVMFSIGTMYYPLALELQTINNQNILLIFAFIFPSLLAILEGVYKSQGILFEAKDNELLFSLPISKELILLSRVIKLYTFQLLYSLLFTIPGVLIYIYFVKPAPLFYFITCLMLLLAPIIPTIIGCFIGYTIKKFSINFKAKKFVQVLITFAIFAGLMVFSSSSTDILNDIISNSSNVEQTIRYYLPIDFYMRLLDGFNILWLALLLIINVLPVWLFILFARNTFFKVVSKSNEKTIEFKFGINKALKFEPKGVVWSLINKEIGRFFSSTVYMFNTLFGLLLLLIATISLCVNFDGAMEYMAQEEVSIQDIATLHMLAPKVYIAVVIAMSFMTSITSSTISLEGKMFNISKSLPVSTEKIFMSKILMSNIITIPVILVCDLIFFFSFKVSIIDIICIVLASFIAPTIAAVFGLNVNLKFPKMDASSDTEVVKQSMSTMVAVMGGILFAGIFVVLTFVLAGLSEYALVYEVFALAFILALLWLHLITKGKKRYRAIEV